MQKEEYITNALSEYWRLFFPFYKVSKYERHRALVVILTPLIYTISVESQYAYNERILYITIRSTFRFSAFMTPKRFTKRAPRYIAISYRT